MNESPTTPPVATASPAETPSAGPDRPTQWIVGVILAVALGDLAYQYISCAYHFFDTIATLPGTPPREPLTNATISNAELFRLLQSSQMRTATSFLRLLIAFSLFYCAIFAGLPFVFPKFCGGRRKFWIRLSIVAAILSGVPALWLICGWQL